VIRTFLFDMGNVLVHFSHKKMCAQIGSLCDLSAQQMGDILFKTDLQNDFERGHITEQQVHAQIETAVGQPLDFDGLFRACCEIFEPNHSIIPILDTLKSRGHRLVLLSNTSISHYRYVKKNYDVLQRFDDVVVSFEVGAIKPEDAIYRAALEKIQCEPQECLYTDDIPEYVKQGRRHGLETEVFTTSERFIEQLSERQIEL